jgi:ATP-binding cassette subfamily B (MDR/TAP) protein 1
MVQYITRTITAVGEASTVVEDFLRSIRNTVAFIAQNSLANKFNCKLTIARDFGIKRGTTLAIVVFWLWRVTYLNYAFTFREGSRLITSSHFKVGALVISIMAIIISAFVSGNIAYNFQAIWTTIGTAYKIFEAIDRAPVIDVSNEKGKQSDNPKGSN